MERPRFLDTGNFALRDRALRPAVTGFVEPSYQVLWASIETFHRVEKSAETANQSRLGSSQALRSISSVDGAGFLPDPSSNIHSSDPEMIEYRSARLSLNIKGYSERMDGGTGLATNAESIEARIREINEAIQMLRSLVTKDFAELTIHEKLSMRYLVIQLVEAASSICVQILLDIFNEKPEGFPECFARLGVKGVIPHDLASKLSSAARLRNLLVHRYWTVDDQKIYESVRTGRKDFKDFTAHVRGFLKERRLE
jgi:uncharacterized protein YutE (UPF0331/DUF86 family)